jgi:hypothetical protein
MPNNNESGVLVPNAELPPPLEEFLGLLKADRKKLMRDPSFGKNPEQLRAYIGTHIYPRFEEMFRTLASMVMDVYQLGATNATGLRKLHVFTVDELNRLGADLDDDAQLPGVDQRLVDEFAQSFFAVGSLLQKKLPEDKEMEEAYNRCEALLNEVVEQLLSGVRNDDYDDDGDDDDHDDMPDDDTDGEEEPKREVKKVIPSGDVDVPGEETDA